VGRASLTLSSSWPSARQAAWRAASFPTDSAVAGSHAVDARSVPCLAVFFLTQGPSLCRLFLGGLILLFTIPVNM